MRDIARVTDVSLAGLYYYFSSKEELLYLIQRHTFETVLAVAQRKVEAIEGPEARLRALIHLHLQFFLDHPGEMKVLTHEDAWLSQQHGRELRAIKRAYYRLCLAQVDALKKTRHLYALNTRLAVLSLFGMMNWIYTWYNPKIDPDARVCAEIMADIFLGGILGGRKAGENGATKAPTGRLTRLDSTGVSYSWPSNGARPLELPALALSKRRAARVKS